MSAALRILFLGTAEFAVPAVRALASGPDDVIAVVTRPDRPAGRGRRPRPSPVRLVASELGLAVHQPDRVSSCEGLAVLREMSPDLLFVAAFGEILTQEALAVGRLGAVNLHASLLPHYRGAAPIQRALLAGEAGTGVTVQWMAKELDAGDIILQLPLAIAEDDDFGSLHDRLASLGARAACEATALLRAGGAPRTPQNAEDATYAPAIRRDELAIDWRRPALEIARAVRAFSPRPGARTTRGGEILKVLAARQGRIQGQGRGIPGRVTEVTDEGFWVETGEGRLLATRVQPAGGRVMSALDYLRGHRLLPGEQLGLAGARVT